jgi:branched-chain amino acid transport system permease protein
MSTTTPIVPAKVEDLPAAPRDWLPLLLVPILILLALPLVGSFPTWATLTIAGLAMGLIIFLVASGLTLVFGLMDVMNFGHGIFVALGAFVGVTTISALGGWTASDSFALNLAAIACAGLAAAVVAGTVGIAFERVIVRPVYGLHLKQILVTMGGMIVAEQVILALWGPEARPMMRPVSLQGSFILGDVAIEKFRLLAVCLGLTIFAAMSLLLNRTKLGLLIRAGVQDREMVEALGYRVRFLFIGVFAAGSALAGLGGTMFGLYQELVTTAIGAQMMVLIFIVIIIGGLGSVGGCFVGALLVGLAANYVGFVAPKVNLFSSILLMVLILLWRPQGLFPVAKR